MCVLHYDWIIVHGDLAVLMEWEQALLERQRAPLLQVNLPLVQPLLWFLPGMGNNPWVERHMSANGLLTFDRHPTILHAERHVTKSSEWVEAVTLTSYQGGKSIAPEPMKTAGERGFSAGQMEA